MAACTLQRPPGEVSSDIRVAAATPELTGVPFFPQEIHQCGPAALATVLGASGVAVTPEELAPFVYIPQRRGSLQTEIIATARRYERLPYVLDPSLTAIAAELHAGRPVLVLQNLGLPWIPRWHYAVVVGMTPDRVILRSGREQRLAMRMSRFRQTWSYGGTWAVVLLPPGEMPVSPQPERWVAANAAFEGVAKPPAVLANYEAAAQTWPGDSMVWFGLGNARYRTGDPRAAEVAYRRAVTLDGKNAAALNNLATVLAERGCRREAMEMVENARAVANAALLEAIDATRTEILAAGQPVQDGADCSR